jgi:hypothetical protein
MTANYVLLEKITVGAAGASSVTFSSIPQTGYTDLVVKASARSDSSSVALLVNFNGNSSSYASLRLYGSGSATFSDTHGSSAQNAIVGGVDISTFTSNTFSSVELVIPNYTSANFKSSSADSVTENNATLSWAALGANLWSNTAAITSIALTPGSGNFVQHSTFYLYGVAALGTTPAIVPYATGGDTIMTDGTYWYHAFTSSGTFTPAKGLSCDVLLVAGGGGGGGTFGGNIPASGGGAGGAFALSAQSLGTSAHTVTIGAGGALGLGSTAAATDAAAGSNSSIGVLTAAVGGGAGSSGGNLANPNRNGGSGGGGKGGVLTQGTGTAGQGFAGGDGAATAPTFGQGGGGGAGAVGGNGGSNPPGAGGAGLNTWSSWLSATGLGVSGYIAGGGGGAGLTGTNSAGGSGGGGFGANGNTGVNDAFVGGSGTANTGGGGGGGGGCSDGGNGGSGLVIVRYAV